MTPRIAGTFKRVKKWDGTIPGTFEPGYEEQAIFEDLRGTDTMHIVLGLEARVFTMGDCRIIVAHEPGGIHNELRWHLTISCRDRHPSWDEIKTARYRLLGPDMAVAMILPPPSYYVNLQAQDHVFQLWEVKDPARVWERG